MTDESAAAPVPVPRRVAVPTSAGDLVDGEWHRLHPATPLLRGGIALIAIIGILISNLRERLVEFFLPGPGCRGDSCDGGDPIGYILDHDYVLIAIAAVAVLLIVLVGGFYLSWRMHTFRITDEVVEVRSGILFRTNRKGRLDRIQGVNIVRPFVPRIFGAAKLEVNVAGQDANVKLEYLSSTNADALRLAVLRLASGTRAREAAEAEAAAGAGVGLVSTSSTDGGLVSAGSADGVAVGHASLIDRRVAELMAPELDPDLAPPESVVKMSPARLVGSTALNSTTLVLLIFIAAVIVAVVVFEAFWVLFTFVPLLLGFGSYAVNRVVKSLRYSIASTPDGIRVGYGLLSTSNETLPPGRIHSISISQDVFWRPTDWWEVKVNRASASSAQGAAGQQNTTILPVGSRADVFRVLELVLPALEAPELRAIIAAGLAKAAADDGFTTSPRRAAVLRWFSWRRNGFAVRPDAVVLRRGAIWRELVVVPTARMQSVAAHQGPLERALRLAHVQVHTVAGPISARLGALDVGDASAFFGDAAAAGVSAAQVDRTHRWRAGEASA